jgi:cytochrome c oxidase assembly protein subunit 11
VSQNVPSDRDRKRNGRVAIICAVTFFGMIGAAYASVPLYRAFCQITGYDGTVRRAETAPDAVLNKTVTVRFDANVRDLPWTFEAEQTSQEVKIGETKLAFFKVTNRSDKPITARAVYNVVPEQAGAYFQKLQCFCFSDQTIAAGATLEMPVLYFIDPKYAQDINTKGKPEVTLSYTFYPAGDAKQAEATKPAPKG